MKNPFLTVMYCLCAINCAALANMVIDDGLVHNIDYAVDQTFYVYDNTTGSSTQVNVLDGAIFSDEVYFENHSQFSMFGGKFLAGFHLGGNSVAAITGGYANGCTLNGDTTTNISGNAEMNGCIIRENATVSIGGNASMPGNIFIMDTPAIAIHGGDFAAMISGSSSFFDISGGLFHDVLTIGSQNGTISDGTFEDEVTLAGNFNISGGSFDDDIYITPFSLITFEGDGFAINGVPLEYGTTIDDADLGKFMDYENGFYTGMLTGILSDGTQISQSILLHDLSEYDIDCGSMNFVPEPGSMWLLLLSGGWLIRRKRQ